MNGTAVRDLARRATAGGGFVYFTFGRHAANKRLVFDDERIKALALFVVSSMEEHHRECMRLDFNGALGNNDSDDSDDDNDNDMEIEEPEGLREALDTLEALLADEASTDLESRDVEAAVSLGGLSARRSGAIPLGDGGHASVLVAVAPEAPPAAPTPAHSAQSTALAATVTVCS